jgi:citrate synthase
MIGISACVGADEEMVASRHTPALTYHQNLHTTDNAIIRSIGYVLSTMAVCYCHIHGKTVQMPRKELTIAENLLHMIGREDPGKRVSRAIDRLWILVADHELSCSTAAFLHVASTMTDPMTCVLAAIAAGSGALHGGAIELGYQGLEMVGSVENVPEYIAAVKAKKSRLFGYGHRLYRTRDPRAVLVEELLHEHRQAVDANPLLKIAMAIDKQANTDPFFVQRGLKLNVDFYGCFLYTAL